MFTVSTQCNAEKSDMKSQTQTIQNNGLPFKSLVIGIVPWTFNSSAKGLIINANFQEDLLIIW